MTDTVDPDDVVAEWLHTGKNVGMRSFVGLHNHEPREWTFREVAERFSVTGFYQLEGVGFKSFQWMDAQLRLRGLAWKGSK